MMTFPELTEDSSGDDDEEYTDHVCADMIRTWPADAAQDQAEAVSHIGSLHLRQVKRHATWPMERRHLRSKSFPGWSGFDSKVTSNFVGWHKLSREHGIHATQDDFVRHVYTRDNLYLQVGTRTVAWPRPGDQITAEA